MKLIPLFRPVVLHIIGNGKRIFLWHDSWHPKGPLLQAYGHKIFNDFGLPLSSKLSVVIDRLNWC